MLGIWDFEVWVLKIGCVAQFSPEANQPPAGVRAPRTKASRWYGVKRIHPPKFAYVAQLVRAKDS